MSGKWVGSPSVRWRERQSTSNAIMVACGAATMVAYISRCALSVMITPMAAEYGWSRSQEAYVLGAFYYGYICTNLLGGVLCRHCGAKTVLRWSMAGWSLSTIMLPWAADRSIESAWQCRMLCGLCQGPTFAAVYHIYANTVKPEQRARAVAALNAGGPLGIVLYYCLASTLESWFGWRGSLRVAGLAALPWLLLWQKMEVDPPQIAMAGPGVIVAAASLPSTHTGASLCKGSSAAGGIPWRGILTTPSFLAIAFAHFSYNLGVYVLLAWLPTYFESALGVSKDHVGVVSVPYLAMLLVVLLGGTAADTLLKRGWGLLAVRQAMTLAGFLPAAACLVLCTAVGSPVLKVLLLAVAMSGATLTTGGVLCNHLDVASELSGVLFGVTNTMGTAGGIVGVSLSGSAIDGGYGWGVVLNGIAALYVVAATGFYSFGSVTKIFA